MAKLVEHFTTFLQSPIIDSIANTIKKFKSSKSYWSTSYALIFLMAREAIAIKWGTKVEDIAQSHLSDNSLEWYEKFFWYAFEFLFSNGAIWLLALFMFIFLVLSLIKVKSTENSEIITALKDESTITQAKLDKILETLNINGDKEKFLKEYFGDDWQKVLEDSQTYHNLKFKLINNTKTTQELLAERNELLKKINSQSLNDSVQKMIDKAFKELRYEDVRALLDNFIETNQAIGDDLIKAHFQKALTYIEQIEYQKAKAEFEEFIPLGIQDAEILYEYGSLYYQLGEYDKMLDCNTKALALNIKEFGENHVYVITNYNEIGLAWRCKGEYDRAIKFYTKGLKITLATLGEKHSSTAMIYNNIGMAWKSKGGYEKAIEFYDKALKIQILTVGENHPSTATSYNNIGGVVWDSQGKYTNTIDFYNKALKINLDTLGENHPSTAMSYNNIAILYFENKEYEKAYPYSQKAVKIWEAILPVRHPHLINAKRGLAMIQEKLKSQ